MARKRLSEAGAQAESDLRYWGYHVGKQYAAEGYPEDSTLLLLLCGHSDLNLQAPKFGINCLDIPQDAWKINSVVMQLTRDLRKALVGRYCLPVVYETGEPIQPKVIAQALRTSVRGYYRLLSTARQRFLLLSVGADSWHSALAQNQ